MKMTRFVSMIFLTLLFLLMGESLGVAQAPPGHTWVSSTSSGGTTCTIGDPCITVQQAIDAVKPGGQVNILNSHEINAFSIFFINKAVTVDGTGTHAAVTAKANSPAITINAGPDDVVILRGFVINGSGKSGIGTHAIRIVSAKAVYLEDITITGGFSGNGIVDERVTGGTLSIEKVAVMNTAVGLSVQGNAMAMVKNSRFNTNGTALFAGGSGKIGISEVTVFGNTKGLSTSGSGMILTFGTNEIAGNVDNGAPTGSIQRQ